MEELINLIKGIKLPQVIDAAITFIVCFLIDKLILRLPKKILDHSGSRIPQTLKTIVMGLVKGILYLMTALITISALGIPISSLVVLLSVVGLAISMAVQGVLNNVAGGLILLGSHPFTIGDYITAASETGTVEGFNLIHTRLKTDDSRIVIIPNSVLHTSLLTNNTVNGIRRVDVSVGVSYDNSPDEVRAAVLEMFRHIEYVEQEPAPRVVVLGYGDSNVEYSVRSYTKPEHYFDVLYAVNEALYTTFRQADIEISYPHMNVHMKS